LAVQVGLLGAGDRVLPDLHICFCGIDACWIRLTYVGARLTPDPVPPSHLPKILSFLYFFHVLLLSIVCILTRACSVLLKEIDTESKELVETHGPAKLKSGAVKVVFTELVVSVVAIFY
jgi:hypothetical protein